MIGAHAVYRADQDWEGAGIDNHRDLSGVASACEQKRDGRHRRRRNRPQHVHQRFEDIAEKTHPSDQRAERDHDRDRDSQPDGGAAQRVDDLRGDDAAIGPERRENRRERREERILAGARGQFPCAEQQKAEDDCWNIETSHAPASMRVSWTCQPIVSARKTMTSALMSRPATMAATRPANVSGTRNDRPASIR